MAIAIVGGLLAVVTILAVRNPLFFRMALRNTVRRPLQMLFSVAGLGVSAVMIIGAFAMGDTLGHSLETRVSNQLGNIDLTITKAAILGPSTPYFDMEDARRIQSQVPEGTQLVPTLAEVVTVEVGDRIIAGTTLVGLPPEYEVAVGEIVSVDGGAVVLGSLADSEGFITRRVAREYGVGAGDVATFTVAGSRQTITIKAVVDLPGWLSNEAGLVLPLQRVQAWRSAPQQVNAILVVSPRSDESLIPGAASSEVRNVRLAVVSQEALQDIMALLSAHLDTVETAYANLVPNSLLYPRVSFLLQALRDNNLNDVATYLGEQDVRLWLLGLPLRQDELVTLSATLERLYAYQVDDTRATATVLSRLEAQNTTTMFMVFGFFSLFAGFMLIFLIVSLLMADRRRETGIFRAIGAKQRHVGTLLFLETCLYCFVGSIIGIGLGAGIARIMVEFLAGGYAEGEFIRFHLSGASLMNAFAFSLVLNTSVSAFAAFRARGINIVAATRGLPEGEELRSSRRAGIAWPARLFGYLLRLSGASMNNGLAPTVFGVACVALGLENQHATPLLLGYSLVGVGLALVIRTLATRLRPLHKAAIDRAAFSLGGLGLLALWAIPSSTMRFLGVASFQAGIEIFLVAGVMEVLGAFWLFRYNMQLVSSLLTLPVRFARRLLAPAKLSVASLTANAAQTALTVSMISLIAFVLTTMFVVTTATGGFTDHLPLFTRGFDIRIDMPAGEDAPDLSDVFHSANLAQGVTGFGGRVDLPVLVRQQGFGDGSWTFYQALAGTDQYFASASGHEGRLLLRAPGFQTDQEVWDALQKGEPVALMTADTVVVRQRFDLSSEGGPFKLNGFYLEDGVLPDLTVEIKFPGGNQTQQLKVVGVVHALANEAGVITNLNNVRVLTPYELAPTKYFVGVSAPENPAVIAAALNAEWSHFGVKATVLQDELTATLAEAESTNGVLAGFAGLGLFVGVASLGVLSARAVSQRRQQIGMVRALGFQKSMVVLSFLLEAVVTCAVGLLVGVILGLALSSDLIHTVNKVAPVMRFAPPWNALGAYVVGAFLFTLLVSGTAARQAAGLRPSEALRYE